jgi:hypothetical protein
VDACDAAERRKGESDMGHRVLRSSRSCGGNPLWRTACRRQGALRFPTLWPETRRPDGARGFCGGFGFCAGFGDGKVLALWAFRGAAEVLPFQCPVQEVLSMGPALVSFAVPSTRYSSGRFDHARKPSYHGMRYFPARKALIWLGAAAQSGGLRSSSTGRGPENRFALPKIRPEWQLSACCGEPGRQHN